MVRSMHARPLSRLPRLLRFLLTAVVLFEGACVGGLARSDIEIQTVGLFARTLLKYDELFGPVVTFDDFDNQRSDKPFAFFYAASASTIILDGVADSYLARPRTGSAPQLYAASVQQAIANAVAVQSTYTGGTQVHAEAESTWFVVVKNTGSAPAPVDFSFFISHGGMEAWCAVCFTSSLDIRSDAVIQRRENRDMAIPETLWHSAVKLVSGSTGSDFFNGFLAGSIDKLGIGFPASSMDDFPDPGDPYHRASISAFDATARLFMLDPGAEEQISYTLTASITGSASAYGAAWLVDPFSLGSTDIALPGSGLAINGVPVAALLVPEPAKRILMLAGLLIVFGLARRNRHRPGT